MTDSAAPPRWFIDSETGCLRGRFCAWPSQSSTAGKDPAVSEAMVDCGEALSPE